MKIDRQYLYDQILKIAEYSSQSTDIGDVLDSILDCVDCELENVKDYQHLSHDWQQLIPEKEFTEITYDPYEQDIEELTSLFKSFINKGYSIDQIEELIEKAQSEL